MSLYLVLEGADGAGKSVQAVQLCQWLREHGKEPLHLREPGSTPVGEALRKVLLDPSTGRLSPLTEALMFSAARFQLLQDQIAPALSAGRTVVVERCFLSSLVYQGMAPAKSERVPMELLRELTAHLHRDLWPDAIFLLDLEPDESAARLGDREDRMEGQSAAYRKRVREGFLKLSEGNPRMHVVDSSQPLEDVQRALREQVSNL